MASRPVPTIFSRLPRVRLRTQSVQQCTSLQLFTHHQRRPLSAYGYEQSKALTFPSYGPPASVLTLHTHSISPPHAHHMTLRFLASPINPADINQIQGVYPSKPAFTTALGTPHPLAVAGNEGVAEIIALGSQVKSAGFKKGDWVLMKGAGFGTWRTHAAATPEQVLLLSEQMREGIGPVQAGTVSVNPCTAFRMLKDFVTLGGGDWFVQNGANSGVGRAAIQIGRRWGLKSVNVIRAREDAAAEERLKAELKELGADVVITDTELQSQDIKDRLASWTDGGRAHVRLGLNCVGGKPATALAKLLDPGAHFVTYGAMARQPLTLPASLLIFKDIRFSGFWVSKWAEENPEEKIKTVAEVLGMMREGTFKDGPVEEVPWGWETKGEELIGRVDGALDGGRAKAVFVFKDT